jgi:hypothetical protein
MRNFRKTRKQGGQQFVADVYACADPDADMCANEFAGNRGWNVVPTADNGNCFYDSLAKYYQRTKNADKAKHSNRELRKTIINAIITRRAEYAHVFVSEDPNGPVMTNAEILKELQAYLKPYQWAGPLGDIVPSVASQILNINITIYDVRDDGRVNMIAMGTGPNGIPNPGLPTINLIRTNGNHFQLLWPNAPAPARRKAKVAPAVPRPAARAPSPLTPASRAATPPRMTTRQLALAAKTVTAAATPAKAPSPPKSAARRKTAKKPATAPSMNTYAQNLQAALLASTLSAKENAARRKKQENNNAQLARAMMLSLGQKPSGNQFAHGSNVFDKTP